MYRFAIIGCGRISHKIAEGLAGNKDKAMLIALSDIVEDKTTSTEKIYNEKLGLNLSVNKYTDYKEMIKNENIDVVIISTESGYHEEIGLYCLENNINVIIEKPIALSIEGDIGFVIDSWANIAPASPAPYTNVLVSEA